MQSDDYDLPTSNTRKDLLWFPPISTNPPPLSLWCKPPNCTDGSQNVRRRKRPFVSLPADFESHEDDLSNKPLDLRCPSEPFTHTAELSQSTESLTSSQLFIECGAPSTSPFTPIAQASLSDSGLGTSTRASLHSASPSPQFLGKSNLYPLQSPECLTAPYQSLPVAENPVYLYTWTLPNFDLLADLAAIHHDCFVQTDQCFGILFSKPISENDYVCRLPLYLSQGMARARVHRAGSLRLTKSQLDRIVACHRVLAELSTNIADLSHVGLQFANRRLRSVMDRIAGEATSSKTLAVRDQFEELDFNPSESRILGLMTFVSLPSYSIDFVAIDNLLYWSKSRDSWKFASYSSSNEPVRPDRGIVRDYPVRLSQIPTEHWAGIMVRPSHLPENDPAMFAISGCSSTIGLDPVPTKLAEKLIGVLNTTSPASPSGNEPTRVPATFSYVDYFVIRHPSIHRIMNKLDGTLPLVNCFRLTRHQNAALVTAGLRKDKHTVDNKLVQYLADICAVHPLSAWLWFLLSTVPLVMYQLSRALLAAQFSAELTRNLVDQEPVAPMEHDSVNASVTLQSTILMPDRLDAPRCVLSELNQCTSIDLEVQAHTPTAWFHLDEFARNISTQSFLLAPLPDHLLEATTLLAARDAVNLERLELLGDSLLQLIATLTVYTSSPLQANEGLLTAQRISLVSNANLFRLAVRFDWPKYCTGQVYSPPSHFLFPCYTVCRTATLPDGDARLFVRLTDKSLADMMEALIGCFLLHLGLPSAVRLLSYFGISPFGKNVPIQNSVWSQLLVTESQTVPNSALLSSSSSTTLEKMQSSRQSCLSIPVQKNQADLSYLKMGGLILSLPDGSILHDQLIGLQNILDYRFTDVSLLVQALIHASSPHVAKFGSYERLEFLGDAVLDYVITVYLYHERPEFDPGKLTESRSNIVSNISLASAIVEHKIHPYIQHSNATIEPAISCITCIHARTNSYSEQLELINQEVLKGLRIKPLADVFESIIGAIFVDTRANLSIVSHVIHRLMDDRIRDYLTIAPINPLRTMHLLHSDLRYTEISPMDSEETGGKYKLCASIGNAQICTYGTTRNEARLALARQLRVPMRCSSEPVTS